MTERKIATTELINDVSREITESGGLRILVVNYSLDHIHGDEFLIPSMRLQVLPNDEFDASDAETGFPGAEVKPPPEKSLRLWADNLLTVSHANAYTLVLHRSVPLDCLWVDLLFPPPKNTNIRLPFIPIFVYFDALSPARETTLSDLDVKMAPSALFNFEDRR